MRAERKRGQCRQNNTMHCNATQEHGNQSINYTTASTVVQVLPYRCKVSQYMEYEAVSWCPAVNQITTVSGPPTKTVVGQMVESEASEGR